jgi:Fe-S oxidoreductase
MSLDEVKEWLYGCTRCGTCKEILNTYDPSCPAGERYHLESFFPSGKLAIARAVSNDALTLEDDEVRERIYACTGCRSCEQVCGVYHHQHIFETILAVRTEAATLGLLNPGYMVMIDGLRKEDNVLGRPKAERGDWARDLKVKNSGTEKTDILYHAGCMLSFDPELWEIPRSAIRIMQAAGDNVGIMGKEESCCGGRAYETGYTGEFTKYSEHFLETGNALGVSKVVTSCSDGYSTFKTLYPKISVKMQFEILHFVEYLDRLIKDDKIKFRNQVSMRVTYHDPCHLGRHVSPGIFDPPRNIINHIPGLELVEMKRNRENAWCCGAGAGVKQANPDFALWTARERLKEAMDTGATALVTACPWCIRNFKDAAQQFRMDIEIFDIAEIAWKSARVA